MQSPFTVGETVSYTSSARSLPYVCTIVRVMPQEHALRSYHIRSDEDVFERSVAETTLSRIVPTAAERIFRH